MSFMQYHIGNLLILFITLRTRVLSEYCNFCSVVRRSATKDTKLLPPYKEIVTQLRDVAKYFLKDSVELLYRKAKTCFSVEKT